MMYFTQMNNEEDADDELLYICGGSNRSGSLSASEKALRQFIYSSRTVLMSAKHPLTMHLVHQNTQMHLDALAQAAGIVHIQRYVVGEAASSYFFWSDAFETKCIAHNYAIVFCDEIQ